MRVSRRERGEGQFGCVVGLIFLALAVFIAFKMIPVKVKAAEVRQVMTDEAKSAGTRNDGQIKEAILAKAREDNLPITEDNIKVQRGNNEITVDLDYVIPIEFPGYTYQWHIHQVAQNPIF